MTRRQTCTRRSCLASFGLRPTPSRCAAGSASEASPPSRPLCAFAGPVVPHASSSSWRRPARMARVLVKNRMHVKHIAESVAILLSAHSRPLRVVNKRSQNILQHRSPKVRRYGNMKKSIKATVGILEQRLAWSPSEASHCNAVPVLARRGHLHRITAEIKRAAA